MEPNIDDMIMGLPIDEKVPIVALKKLGQLRQEVDQKQEKQVNNIRIKYQKLLEPLLARASQIIRGKNLRSEELKSSQLIKQADITPENLKGKVIDHYWSLVLTNSPLADQISSKDEQALQSLVDIQLILDKKENDTGDISLKFIFCKNVFFNQTQIIRHLRAKDGRVFCIEGDKIVWNDGKFLTHQIKKVSNRNTGEQKFVQGKKIKSIFDIFLDWNVEDGQQLIHASQIMREIGNMIVMDSVSYFLGLINIDEEDSQDELDQDEEGQSQKKIKTN